MANPYLEWFDERQQILVASAGKYADLEKLQKHLLKINLP
jgi:hypothetical protein